MSNRTRFSAIISAALLIMAFTASSALALSGFGLESGERLYVTGSYITGIADANGETTATYTCAAAAAGAVASVTIPADGGCVLEQRIPGFTDWTAVDSAPGRSLPGAVTVTADAPVVASGAFRVCFEAEAAFIDGTGAETVRACSNEATFHADL